MDHLDLQNHLFTGVEELGTLDRVSFENLYHERALFSIRDPEKEQLFRQLFQNIQEKFNYPDTHNCLILFYLLFNTEFWTMEDHLDLREPNRIKSISDFSIELLRTGNDHIKNDLGIQHLSQLAKSVTFISQLVKDNKSRIQNAPKPSFNEEPWINEMVQLYDSICHLIRPDSSLINTCAAVAGGKFHLINQWNKDTNGIWNERFQKIFGKAIPPSTNWNTRIRIGSQNADLAKLLIIIQFDFRCYDLKGQLEYFYGFQNPAVEHLRGSQMVNIMNMVPDRDFVRKYRNSGQYLGRFLIKREWYVLFLLITLMNDTEDNVVQTLCDFMISTLSRKLHQSPEHKYYENPIQIIQAFFSELFNFAKILQEFLIIGRLGGGG